MRVWTGEFDYNTLRVDGEAKKKKRWIKKISGYVWTGPWLHARELAKCIDHYKQHLLNNLKGHHGSVFLDYFT